MAKKRAKSRQSRNIVHDDWKLRKATDYLEFDIHSFAAGLDIYLKHRGSEIGNAALDSFLVRARLLMDFFFRDSGQQDDVIALDYFHDVNPMPYKPRMTKSMRGEREKINKRLVHLTTQPMPRLRSNQRYSINKFAPQIVRAFRKWLAVVPKSRIQKPASRSIKTFEKHLQRIEKLIS
jgi:hypothetical protein